VNRRPFAAAAPAMAPETPAELISSFAPSMARSGRGVMQPSTACQSRRARWAAKDNLSHEVLGPFTSGSPPARAGRAAENMPTGYENFEKTLGQWVDSSGHRRTAVAQCLPRRDWRAPRMQAASAPTGAMVIARRYDRTRARARRQGDLLLL